MGPKKRPRKVFKVEVESSDDEVPLGTLQKLNIEVTTQKWELPPDADDVQIQTKFNKLIDAYEILKSKSLALDHEIKVLERANIRLKNLVFG